MTHWVKLLSTALVLVAVPASAVDGRTTLYLDGARIETTAVARKGIATITLPPGMLTGSLRVTPLGRTVIDRVMFAPPVPPKDAERERRTLEERRDALEDRLAALTVKEDIFKAAAKAQSGKAPKRTKTNPDPLATIRQGTDYAVAQLEAVYRSRRLAERELSRVRRRLATLVGDPAAVGSTVRVAVHGGDQVRASYLLADRHWTPMYELRLLDSGEAQLVLKAEGGAASVVPASLLTADSRELSIGEQGVVMRHICRIVNETAAATAQDSVRVDLACSGIPSLPAGTAACYSRGIYLGETTLPRLSSAGTFTVTCGAFSAPGTRTANTTTNE